METQTAIPISDEDTCRMLDGDSSEVESEPAAELWMHILEHKWFMSERLGRDVGIKVACLDYIENIDSTLKELSEHKRDRVLNELRVWLGEVFNGMVQQRWILDAIKHTFGPYLSPEIVNEILRSPGGVGLKGELREITILVSDIRRFTRTTESLAPEQVLQTINRYLEKMTDIIVKHGGTIDEFTGDGILVFFGAPGFLSDHCASAVACALEMQKAMQGLNKGNRRLGLPELEMGIGISSGPLIVGNIGSARRKKYGAVGNLINLAFRIQSEAKGGEVLVSSSVFHSLAGELLVEEARHCSLKGFEQPVILHRVTDLKEKPE
jgi:class 3 adenylate cyclase